MVLAINVLAASCSTRGPSSSKGTATSPANTTATSSASQSGVENVWKAAAVDSTKVPLGDGHKSTTTAAVGNVLECSGGGGIGGATVNGTWIHGTTWDSTAKVAVEGAVAWPNASYSMKVSGRTRTIVTNDLPTGQKTGVFPIASNDPAAAFDQNPNGITPKPTTLTLPVTPSTAPSPTCLGGGPIGVLTDGVFVFDALDGPGRDATAHETQDLCGGHPAPGNEYHHHDVSTCIRATATGPSTVVGWAFDGFPIVVERDAAGHLPTNADLDECHGRTAPIIEDGKAVTIYHYSATLEYPYTLGCYRGLKAVVG